jgi:hypothetical protein
MMHKIFCVSASISFDKLTSSSAMEVKSRLIASSKVTLILGLISGIFGKDIRLPHLKQTLEGLDDGSNSS